MWGWKAVPHFLHPPVRSQMQQVLLALVNRTKEKKIAGYLLCFLGCTQNKNMSSNVSVTEEVLSINVLDPQSSADQMGAVNHPPGTKFKTPAGWESSWEWRKCFKRGEEKEETHAALKFGQESLLTNWKPHQNLPAEWQLLHFASSFLFIFPAWSGYPPISRARLEIAAINRHLRSFLAEALEQRVPQDNTLLSKKRFF